MLGLCFRWSSRTHLGLAALIGGGCSDTGAAPTSDRVICPQCVVYPGEEQPFARFGPGPVRTRCDETSSASLIDEAQARALGFGAIIDRIALPVDVPFEWTAGEPLRGSPATGYTPLTRLQGTLRPTAFRHLSPSEEGCQDSLVVAVDATLQTSDGAFLITGQLYSGTLQPETRVPSVGARLNLRNARGSLELFPPTGDQPLDGRVSTSLVLWPGGTRAELRIDATNANHVAPSDSYGPLRGRGPMDACEINSWPHGADGASVTGSATSFATLYAELLSWFGGAQPFPALWAGGVATSVRVQFGDPVDLCEASDSAWHYQVPLDITSDDGRVHIQHEAAGYLTRSNGAWRQGWVEVYNNELEDTATFAEATGIEGIDFEGIPGARWTAVQHFEGDRAPLAGEIVIETILRGSALELDRLTW
jgi:hypothetical protein